MLHLCIGNIRENMFITCKMILKYKYKKKQNKGMCDVIERTVILLLFSDMCRWNISQVRLH